MECSTRSCAALCASVALGCSLWQWTSASLPGSPGPILRHVCCCSAGVLGVFGPLVRSPRKALAKVSQFAARPLTPCTILRQIAHPRVLPFLRAFVGEVQLVNIWSISKVAGSPGGGYHAGLDRTGYSIDPSGEAARSRCCRELLICSHPLSIPVETPAASRGGCGRLNSAWGMAKVRSQMLNCVWMLTDNGL